MSDPALIIGALGQDGRLLAQRLRRDAVAVIGVARPGTAGRVSVEHPLEELDVTQAAGLEALIERTRPGRIFYLAAAHHSAEGAPTDRLATWPPMLAVNCSGVAHTVRAILRHVPQCRLVFAASSQMYTPEGKDLRVDETTRRQPRTFYGHTKSWSIDLIAFARATEGLNGASAILFNHESPLRHPSFVTRKVTLAAAGIRNGSRQRLTIANLGARADWSAAEDVVDALVRISQAPVPEDFVVGSGRLHSLQELIACAFSRAGLDWRDHVEAVRHVEEPTVCSDPSRIRDVLGWVPRQTFETTIHAMVDADLAAAGSPA